LFEEIYQIKRYDPSSSPIQVTLRNAYFFKIRLKDQRLKSSALIESDYERKTGLSLSATYRLSLLETPPVLDGSPRKVFWDTHFILL